MISREFILPASLASVALVVMVVTTYVSTHRTFEPLIVPTAVPQPTPVPQEVLDKETAEGNAAIDSLNKKEALALWREGVNVPKDLLPPRPMLSAKARKAQLAGYRKNIEALAGNEPAPNPFADDPNGAFQAMPGVFEDLINQAAHEQRHPESPFSGPNELTLNDVINHASGPCAAQNEIDGQAIHLLFSGMEAQDLCTSPIPGFSVAEEEKIRDRDYAQARTLVNRAAKMPIE